MLDSKPAARWFISTPIVPLLAVSLAVPSLLTACGGAGESPAPTTPVTAASPTTQPTGSPAPSPAAVWPLTGLRTQGATPRRPAMVVKVDNTRAARPQVGLGSADLIVEELVEGGLTRLAVFYYEKLPPVVGPVRSLRTSDIAIVAPTDGVLVASGGAAKAQRKVERAGVRTALPGMPGFYRDRARSAPYNLMLQPASMAESLRDLASPPAYFEWAGESGLPAGGEPAATVSVKFSGAHKTRWSYAPGVGWRRVNELAADRDRFTAANLLVLRVRTQDAGYRDPAGNPVPETVLTGSGEAVLLRDGQAIRARWTKGADADPLRLQKISGEMLAVPPGRTWVELLPPRGSVTWSR